MKHVRSVSLVRADATSDFTNAIFVAWKDFLYAQGLGFLDSFDFLTNTFNSENFFGGKSS